MSEQPINSGQNPAPPLNQNSTPPPNQDWREQRRAERMKRMEEWRGRRGGRHFGWFTGVILILLGIIFLLHNAGIALFVNWWALFILFPAFWAFFAAWNMYRYHQRVTRGAIISFTIAVLFTILAIALLFDLALGQYWAILLVIGGVVLIVTALLPGRDTRN